MFVHSKKVDENAATKYSRKKEQKEKKNNSTFTQHTYQCVMIVRPYKRIGGKIVNSIISFNFLGAQNRPKKITINESE